MVACQGIDAIKYDNPVNSSPVNAYNNEGLRKGGGITFKYEAI